MLKHAVRALRADKQKALTAFSRGADGFSQRDLYVFCFGPDGKVDAHPNPAMIGKDASLLKDKDGKAFGQEMLKVAQPGPFAEVTYWWQEPLVSGDGAYGEPTTWGGLEKWSNDPVRKTSYVTRIDDHVCGVVQAWALLSRSASWSCMAAESGSIPAQARARRSPSRRRRGSNDRRRDDEQNHSRR
jgi:hypothetical protein